MQIFGLHLHRNEAPMERAPHWALELYALGMLLLERTENMATKDQIDKLTTDVAALIDAAVAEIASAFASAQMAQPGQADAAIDALDARVKDTTAKLTDAAAQLKAAAPAPTDPNAPTAPTSSSMSST